MKTFFATLCQSILSLCIVAIAHAASAAEVLPHPEPVFKGKIGFSVEDSAPDWPQPSTAPNGAPNIVLIMLDDVGFGDVSTFGGPAQTPALDRLALQGLRYNRFHTTSICSPTRAALLSGRNQHRIGWGGFGGGGFPGYDGRWPKRAASIAEVLRGNGYRTAAFGKWHNTPYDEITPVGPFERWPTGKGFDYFYGFIRDMTSQWEPALYRNHLPALPPATAASGYHLTTDLVNDAIGWIHTHQSLAADKPYFLYLATGAAHIPHHVPREWIAKYRGKFDQGWDRLREETFARQKRLGVIPPNTQLTPRPKELPAWNSLSADERRLFSRQMEIFAAFIAHTDHEVGRLIKAAQDGPGADNTLILYLVGDNGDDANLGITGLESIPVDETSRSVQQQLKHLEELGGPKYINGYASAWAWAGSTPFQWAKAVASHFGGTRNPLVVSWPARIKARSGLRTQFTHVIDIAPTIYEAAGIAFPAEVDGVAQMPLDGVSFADTFDDPEAVGRHRVQYFEAYGNRAIYQEGWLAAVRHGAPWSGPVDDDYSAERWELYHVAEDFSQAHDLAARYPDKLQALQALFDSEARRNQVYPLGGGNIISSSVSDKRLSVFRSGVSAIPTTHMRTLQRSSYRITAHVALPKAGAEGVLLAYGGRSGGFSIYVQNNHLVYENNSFGRVHDILESKIALPAGEAELAVELQRDSPQAQSGGTAYLYVNQQLTGQIKLPHIGEAAHFENFDIGQDSASPVSSAYASPFKFTGAIKKVTVELK